MTTLPFFSTVQFSGAGISTQTLGPNTLKITQNEYMHDTGVMEFWGGDVDADALISGTPMILTFGTASAQRVFYGYVNHPQRTNNSFTSASTLTQRNAVTVTCVGASWPMKQTGNQVFTSMTTWQIIQNIADQFGLDTDIVPDTTLWPSKQMAGATYWQFCVGLAQQIGYTFYCNGIQLVFKPRQTNPAALSSLAAVYDYTNNPAGLPIFNPTLGATSPMGGQLANRQQAGINPRTMQPIYSQVSGSPTTSMLGSVTVPPAFNKTQHYTVSSQEEANTKTGGAGALNQLFITATASAAGNPFVSQGSLIFVQNANGSQNGLWFVTGAMHCFNTQTYSMNLDLGRDSMGVTQNIYLLPQTQASPAAALTNGSWVAVAA